MEEYMQPSCSYKTRSLSITVIPLIDGIHTYMCTSSTLKALCDADSYGYLTRVRSIYMCTCVAQHIRHVSTSMVLSKNNDAREHLLKDSVHLGPKRCLNYIE